MVRVEKTVVSGVFSLDGQDFDVENNVWLVGDDDEVLVIDAPHRAEPILEAIGGRRVAAIVLPSGSSPSAVVRSAAAIQRSASPGWPSEANSSAPCTATAP